MRGCVSDATNPVEFDGEKLLRCPRRLLLDDPWYVNEIWWLYAKYVDGILPEHGGLYDQPAKYLAVMRILDSAKSGADSEKQEQDKRRKAVQAHANRAFEG
jgi:hypothetical protein